MTALAAMVAAAAAEPPQTAQSAAARLPHVRVIVHKADRATLQRRKAMRLTVRSTGPGYVRISTTHKLREGTRLPRTRTAKRRVIQFRRRGSKRVNLKLTGAGRRLLASCRRVRVRIAVRVFRRNRAGRRRARRSSHTKHSMRHMNFEAPLCPESNVVGDTRNPGGGRGGGGGGGGPGGGGAQTSELRAGAAASDMTPPIGTPMFAYTARSAVRVGEAFQFDPNDPAGSAAATAEAIRQILADPDENLYAKSFEPSDGIHTRVLARALVIERKGEKFALVQADLGGLPYALTQEVARRVAATGITGERLMLSATHTHGSTGPIWPADATGYAALGGDFFDPRIFELTAASIAEAIIQADRNLEPARVGVGTAELRNASRNREFEPAFVANPEVKDLPPEEQRARSIDPQVTVIRADALSGGPIGIWTNFAIHPTSLGDDNLLFTGDNAATAERDAEAAIARDAGREGLAPPPDRPMVNVWTNSNEGDISPNGDPDNPDGEPLQYVQSGYASANLAGARVAEGTVRAWRSAGDNLQTDMEIGARRTFFLQDGTEADGRPVGPHTVLGMGGIVADDGTCAPFEDMAGPGQGRKAPAIAGAGLVPQHSPVALWRFGATGITALPLEVTKTMGARIRDRLAQESGGALQQVVLAGLTNSYQSYNATPEEYQTCTYEGSFTLFGVQQGARFRDVAVALVDPLLTGGPAPQFTPEPPPTGFGSPTPPKARSTPQAGTPVEQPEDAVSRFGSVRFRWNGGEPNVEAPRNRPFVSLQRRIAGDWVTVGTDDGVFDATWLEDDAGPGDGRDVYHEVWQFTECDPVDTYRFRVTGRANKGDGTRDYVLDSEPFELRRMSSIQIIDSGVHDGTARVRARYPPPAPGALVALPRRVRTGTATLQIRLPDGGVRTVIARPDAAGLAFTAAVPPGSTIESVRVEDGCGNTGP